MANAQLGVETGRSFFMGGGGYQVSDPGYLVVGSDPSLTANAYVTFNPAGLLGFFTEASVTIKLAGYVSPDPVTTISLHDVSYTGVVPAVASGDAFFDLQQGDLYGIGNIAASPNEQVVTFTLSQAALDDFNAAIVNGTRFSIGLTSETDGDLNGLDALQFSASPGQLVARLDLKVADPTATPGADNLAGAEGSNVISALAGNDTVRGLLGNDTVYGNQGSDELYGNQGADNIYGGQDNDTVFGGQDGDYIEGNFGADVLYGNFGDDTIFGGRDNDTLYGGRDNDVLVGGISDDLLVGGLGGDVYAIQNGHGNDTIVGFSFAEGDVILPIGDVSNVSFANNAQGNAVISYDGGTITVLGFTAEQLTAGPTD